MSILLTPIAALAIGQAPAAPANPVVVPVRTFVGARVIALAPAPTGSRFAASMENRNIRIYDAATGMVVRAMETPHPQPAYAVAWSRDGRLIASGDESARIWVWDANTGRRIREMRTHTRGVQALNFSPDGRRLVSTGKDDSIRVYDLSNGRELLVIPGNGANFYGTQYLPDGATLLTATLADGGRTYQGSNRVGSFRGVPEAAAWDVAYDATRRRVVVAGRDGVSHIFDVRNGQRLAALRGHEDWVVHVRLTPSASHAITSSSDRTVRIWDLRTNQAVQKIEGQSFVGSPLTVTADGRFLVTVNQDDWLQTWRFSNPVAAPAARPAPARQPARRR